MQLLNSSISKYILKHAVILLLPMIMHKHVIDIFCCAFTHYRCSCV